MRQLLAILPFVVIGITGTAYAQPLDEVSTTVLDVVDSTTTVQISWNHDSSVHRYESGCVSCFPNIVQSTTDDTIILKNVTALANGRAILYLVAYDDSDTILAAKQIMVDI